MLQCQITFKEKGNLLGEHCDYGFIACRDTERVYLGAPGRESTGQQRRARFFTFPLSFLIFVCNHLHTALLLLNTNCSWTLKTKRSLSIWKIVLLFPLIGTDCTIDSFIWQYWQVRREIAAETEISRRMLADFFPLMLECYIGYHFIRDAFFSIFHRLILCRAKYQSSQNWCKPVKRAGLHVAVWEKEAAVSFPSTLLMLELCHSAPRRAATRE